MAVDRHKKSKERAQKLVQDGDLRGALEVYQKIVAEEPNELACLTRVAELSRELGQTVDAYGKTLGDGSTLASLLRRLHAICRYYGLAACNQPRAKDNVHHGV